MINNTPVLLITYRRSKNISKQIDKLISTGFKDIYIYSNCWRDLQKDKEAVENTREIILSYYKEYKKKININFSKSHLTVDKSITSAINWFFSNVNYGIILEDDIQIEPLGLRFLSLGLEYYKSYTNIASITAFTEYLYENNIDTLLPRFSYMFHSWGWATWKKIWEKFDHLDAKNYIVDNFKNFMIIINYIIFCI